MKIITWNARGMNRLKKRRFLKKNIRTENPYLIFIQETKCTIDKMKEVDRNFGRNYYYLYVKLE